MKWWNTWKQKKEKNDNIIIESITLSDFREKCSDPKFRDYYTLYFRKGAILEPHPDIHDKKIEEDLLYIRHIKNSDISTDLKVFGKRYFLAEYFERDLEQKESEFELKQLNTIYDEIYDLWQVNHNLIYSNRRDDDGNDLLNKIQDYLLNNFNYFQKRLKNLTLRILLGLILKMSDRNIIYWTRKSLILSE